MRFASISFAGLSALVLSACADGSEEASQDAVLPQGGQSSESPEDLAQNDVEGATPLEQRVATLGLLNKRNNESQDFEIRPGERIEEGAVIISLSSCERTAPWEMPQETGAFVQLDVLERGESEHTRVFSGWLFKEAPSLNVVEHPIYDVWVKDCAMRFPGEVTEEG